MYNDNELISDIATLKLFIYEIELKIEIYSSLDNVKVISYNQTKRELELLLLDLMNKQNNKWLESLKVA